MGNGNECGSCGCDNTPETAPEGHTSRRDFIYMTAGAMAAVGVGAVAWPAIQSMNPAADTLAMATTEVDLSKIEAGQAQTVMWRGKPVFVRRRTPEEIAKAEADDAAEMVDKQTDADRAQRKEWLIVVGVCTHLGCVPVGQKMTENRGEYGGWFCPCHGSHYDTSGRIRKGPAPKNLEVPQYTFVSDTLLRIG
jgi:ubiquinol-cytochrome c reductase iron-sulfur subunit